jgi:hypothetical protein
VVKKSETGIILRKIEKKKGDKLSWILRQKHQLQRKQNISKASASQNKPSSNRKAYPPLNAALHLNHSIQTKFVSPKTVQTGMIELSYQKTMVSSRKNCRIFKCLQHFTLFDSI